MFSISLPVALKSVVTVREKNEVEAQLLIIAIFFYTFLFSSSASILDSQQKGNSNADVHVDQVHARLCPAPTRKAAEPG